jgi:DNA-binding transcriptional regulator YdaS (Cro superfamily)
MDLKTYLATLTLKQRAALAKRCKTTAGHLRNVSYGDRTCGESLAIDLERESGGLVTCEEMRADVDWAYIRGTAPRSRKEVRTGTS